MLDFQEFQELNEAFNSEPYPVVYSVVGQVERYSFQEDDNKQYKIEILKAPTIPLGKDVRTLRIAYKSTGNSYSYRPVIGKFKDPRRVIATILDILNKYKDEGRLGARIKGFAIRLQGSNFGAYAGFVNRIAKQYLRQQFDVKQDAVYDAENDANLVLINRKGTQFDRVFADYVSWSNAAMDGHIQAHPDAQEQQNDVMSTLASIQPAEDKTGHWFVRYELLGGFSDTDAMQIVSVTTRSYGDVYTLQLYNKYGGSLGQVVQSANDIDASLWEDIGRETPNWETLPSNSTEQEHRFDVGDFIRIENSLATDTYYEITGIAFDGDNTPYYELNQRIIGSDEVSGQTRVRVSIGDRKFVIFEPPQVAQSLFSVGDLIHNPSNAYYYYEVLGFDGTYYTLRGYSKATNDVAIEVATATQREVNNTFETYERISAENTGRKFNVGDKIERDSTAEEGGNYYFYIITDVSDDMYTMDRYLIESGALDARGMVKRIARVDGMFRLYTPAEQPARPAAMFAIGDKIEKNIRVEDGENTFYYEIVGIEYGGYTGNKFLQSTGEMVERGVYMGFTHTHSSYRLYVREERPAPRFFVGDIIAKPSAEMYAKVLEIVGSDYIVQTFDKANNRVIDQRIDFPIETVDSAFEPYTPIETPQPIFSLGQNVSRVTPTLSDYYYEIWDIVLSPLDGGEPYYRLYAYKKATRRRNRGNDGILKFSIIHERYDAYNPRTGEFYNQNPNLQAAQQPQIDFEHRFNVGEFIARGSISLTYAKIVEVKRVDGVPTYIYDMFNKATNASEGRGSSPVATVDGLDFVIYTPLGQGQNVAAPATTSTPAEPTLFDYSLLVNRPVVSRQVSSFNEITSTGWYYAQIPSAGSAFLFLQAIGNNWTTERRYKVDGDIYDDGELNRYDWREGTVYHRLDRPPVFKKTSYPHRYNVGDSVNYNGDVQKVLGFRGKFYILDREENFVMISSVDASATTVSATATTQSSQPAFPAKTREEHMADFAKAKDEYGVVVGESVVDYMIRYCPAATVYDICKAMFGEPNTDTGDGRKIWLNGDTITASQNGGSIHGAPLQRLTRQFKFGESYVYHDYLMMKPSSQGGGATKKLFTESIPLYEKMGFKKVKVYANIDVGAAIWSRYGFKSYETMDQSSWDRFLSNRISQVKNLERSISRLDEFDSLHQAELQGVINLLEGFKQSGYFSDYPAMVCSLTVPNVEALFQEQLRQYCSGAKPNLKLNIGKMLMWGNGYRGELDLSDRKSYNRMARYVGLPTR